MLPSTEPRTPLIYFLKKLHKQPISVRPIVSHVNSATSNISAFIDTLLKPIVKEIPHILSNSIEIAEDLLTIPCSNNTTLVTMDVTSLYPNIPIQESITVILNIIKEYNNPTHPPLCILNQLLSFVLYYNCFNFGDLFFLQVHGIAMGTKLAPNYANLFMSDFENKHVFTQPVQPIYYRRYIDDIFFIWDRTVSELENFVNHLNSVHPTIKFTKDISNTTITFLDLDIYKKDNSLQTKTHFKLTNTFSYLHGTSNHPSSTFKGIHQGENIRMLRNTTDPDIYNKTMDFIKERFNGRKYPAHLLDTPIIDFSQRDQYLSKNKSNSKNKGPTFITTYDPSISIKDVLLQDWPRITSDSDLRKRFRDPPTISYRHAPNLSQLLVRAKLSHKVNTNLAIHPPPRIPSISYPSKNIKCRHPQCATCPQLTDKSHYNSFQTKHYYQINKIFSCDTTPAIYLLECRDCCKQYIGETHTTVRSRMKHHRNMFKSATNRPLYAHCSSHKKDFSIYSITVIDQVTNTLQRKQKEQYYINLLKTKLPFGLNVIQKQ